MGVVELVEPPPVLPPLPATPEPLTNGCPFGIVPEKPPTDAPGNAAVPVSDLPANALAPAKTPAANATAPTPSNGFNAKADATPATIDDAFKRLYALIKLLIKSIVAVTPAAILLITKTPAITAVKTSNSVLNATTVFKMALICSPKL